MSIDKMLSINTPKEMAEMLALRLREHRLQFAWSRAELARRSDVTVASLKRFESTGEISLKNLLKLCFTLHALDDFEKILPPMELTTMADIHKFIKKRKRGRTGKS